MALIRAEQIRKNYVQGKQIVEVLKGVEFCAGQGEFIAVLGASGSGKTTLLHTLAGFEKPDAGRIWIGGYPLHQMKEKRKNNFLEKKYRICISGKQSDSNTQCRRKYCAARVV